MSVREGGGGRGRGGEEGEGEVGEAYVDFSVNNDGDCDAESCNTRDREVQNKRPTCNKLQLA
jgi:hypothetical protein